MRRFAESVIAWWERYNDRYRNDLFFHTSVNIIMLQALFVCAVISSFLAVDYIYRDQRLLIMIFGAFLLAIVFGVLLARMTLIPMHKVQWLQKLFISNVAHGLRTPLTTIKTSSEVALLDETLAPSVKGSFVEIIEELDRVSEIINNLLSLNTLTRPEQIEFEEIDLVPVAEEVVRKYQGLARERGIRLTLHHEAGSIAYGNHAAFEQIMTNLIKNALTYTPEDTNGSVTVSLRPTTPEITLFSVADTGVGMSQQEVFHAFEPFYRGDTSRTRAPGTGGSGLGLNIVSELVRTHHGKISVESKRHRGTTISVLLPHQGHAHHMANAKRRKAYQQSLYTDAKDRYSASASA